jgi:integrase
MEPMALTQKKANELKPDGTDRVEWDLPGFGVRVRASGAKSWVVKYRVRTTGAQRKMTLGTVERVPLSMARAEAKRLLAKAALGKDPAHARARVRRGLTVAALSEEWLAALESDGAKATTLGLYRHNLSRSILPKLGKRPARTITAQDVRQLYYLIRDAGQATKANRVKATLSSLLGWGVRRDHLPSNVALGAVALQDRAKERADDRHLSEAEVARFLAACEKLRGEGGHHGRVAVGFELILFCGLRPSDVFRKDGDGLKWSEIDADAGLIRFESQKAGDAPAYLRGPARALLASLGREPGDVFVFPSNRTGRALHDVRTTWDRVVELAEFDDPRPAPKCLRKTLASSARAWGFTLETIKPLLRHSEKGDVTTAHYAHADGKTIGDAAEEIANRLAGLGEPAKVVKLKTGAK